MLKLLRRGGRFTSSGAIAGPIVDLDMRDMYLKDISLIGTTAWDEPVFPILCPISNAVRSNRFWLPPGHCRRLQRHRKTSQRRISSAISC